MTSRRLRQGTALVAAVVCAMLASCEAALADPTVQVFTDEPVSAAPWLGLGVELDPYDRTDPRRRTRI